MFGATFQKKVQREVDKWSLSFPPGDYRFPFSLVLLSFHFSWVSDTQPFPAATFSEGSAPAADWACEAAVDTQPLGRPPPPPSPL